MSETVISILVWLHVIGVAIWLGGQIVTAACVIPALRAVGDRTIWLNALEGFTRRFGRIGIAAMVVIVITGGAMIDPRLDQVENFGEDLYAARWGYIFVIKMALWAVMIALIGLHQFVFGPRQLELARESAEADEDTPELQTRSPHHHRPLHLRPADDPARRRGRSLPRQPQLLHVALLTNMSRSILARALAVSAPILALAALLLFAGSSRADAQDASLSVSLATWKSADGTIELCIGLRDAAVGETRQCPERRLLTFARAPEFRWLRSRSIDVAPEVELWIRARRVGQRLDLGLGVSIEGVRRGLRARSWSLDWPATPVDQWRETSEISLQLPVAPYPDLWDTPAGIVPGAKRLQMDTVAPEFRLPRLGADDDVLVSLSSTRSADVRLTLIVFWASWAPLVGETLTVLSNSPNARATSS